LAVRPFSPWLHFHEPSKDGQVLGEMFHMPGGPSDRG
jgi:hypothetical protein